MMTWTVFPSCRKPRDTLILSRLVSNHFLSSGFKLSLHVLNCDRGCGYAAILNIVEICGQMRPKLQSRCGFGGSENHDIATVVVVVDHNLKPWSLLCVCCGYNCSCGNLQNHSCILLFKTRLVVIAFFLSCGRI